MTEELSPIRGKGERRKPSRWRRWARRLLVASGCLVALVVVLYLFRFELFGGIMRREIAAALAESLGGRYEVAEVSGDLIFGVKVRGLTTVEPGTVVSKLEFAEARITYRLLDFLQDNPVAGLKRIEVEGLVLALSESPKTEDPSRPTPPTNLAAPGFLEQLPAQLPELVVAGRIDFPGLAPLSQSWRILLTGAGNDFNLEAEALLEGTEDQDRLQLELQHKPRESLALSFSGSLAGLRFDDGRAELDQAGSITAATELLIDDGKVSLSAAGQNLKAELRELSLANLPVLLRRELDQVLAELPTAGLLNGQLSWNFQSHQIAAEARIDALDWGRLRSAEVDFAGRLLATELSLDRLQIKESRGQALLQELSLNTKNILESVRVATAEIQLEDIQRLTELVPSDVLNPYIREGMNLRAQLQGNADELVVRELELTGESLSLRAHGTLEIPQPLADWRQVGLDLSVQASVIDLQSYWPPQLVPIAAWRSNLDCQGSVAKPVGSKLEAAVGQFAVTATETEFRGVAFTELSFAVIAEGSELQLEQLSARSKQSMLTARGSMSLREKSAPEFDLSLSVETEQLAEASALSLDWPGLAGSATLEAKVTGTWPDLDRSLATTGTIAAENLSLDGDLLGQVNLAFDREAAAPFNLKGGWASPRDEQLSFEASVEHLAEEWIIGVDDLVAEARGLKLELTHAAQARIVPNRSVQLSPIDFRAFGGSANLAATWSAAKGFDINLEAKNIDPGGFSDRLSGRLQSAKLSLQGDLNVPTWSAAIVAPDLVVASEPVALRLQAAERGDGIEIETLRLESSYAEIMGQGFSPLRVGRAGLLWSPQGRNDLSFKIVANDLTFLKHLNFPKEIWSRRFAGDLELKAGGLELAASLSAPSDASLQLPISTEPLTVTLEVLAKSAQLDIQAGSEGRAHIDLDLTRAWRLPAEEVVIDQRLSDLVNLQQISGQLSCSLPDLSQFEILSDDLVRLEGRAEAEFVWSDLTDNSDLRGELSLHELSLRFEGFPGLAVKAAQFGVRDRELTINSFAGELGYAPFQLAGGLLWDERDQLQADLSVTGQNVLVYRNRYARARCNLDCEISGSIDALHFSGSAEVTDAVYSEPIRFLDAPTQPTAPGAQLFSLRDSFLEDATFDIEVTADQSILVANNVAYGALSADLHLGGNGAYPEPKGRVYFRDFQVTLPFSKLVVSRGELLFEANRQMDPNLSIFAATRMRGYDLNLQVRGTSSAPIVDVAANPPLPREDALILLTTGATPGQLKEQGLTQATLTRTGKLLGQSILEAFSDPSDPERDGYLDRFSIEIGRDVSNSGTSTIESEVRLSDHFFIRFERDRYEEHNLGVVWRWTFK